MNFFKQHNQGIIGATVYTVVAILILLLLGFTIPVPPPVEECILLDFGGGGNPNAGASASASSNHNTSTQNSNSNSNSNSNPVSGVETQAFEDAASLQSSNVKTETQEQTQNTTEPVSEPQPTVNQRAANLGFGNVTGGTGTGNSGTGTGGGNPGYGGGSGSGGGNGTNGLGGIGGNIGNRKVTKVEPDHKDNMTGTVVLKVMVNEKGIVENVSLVSSNCSECTQYAIAAVKKWKYEAKPGTGTQTGQVTVEFKQK